MKNRYRDGNAQEYAFSAVVFVEVKKPNNDRDIGTAFHIGSGYFVTARHVIEGNEITKVGQGDLAGRTRINPDRGTTRNTDFPAFDVHSPRVDRFTHPNDNVDVAIFRLNENLGVRGPAHDFRPHIELADNVDAFSDRELLMTAVRVLGYPRIPRAMDPPPLVTSPGEICAVASDQDDKKRHLIVSSMARGGFSGGPVLSIDNPQVEQSAESLRDNTKTALGIVIMESREATLGQGGQSDFYTPGFLHAVSIETVREVINHHKLDLGGL
jgi:hypothetical protein